MIKNPDREFFNNTKKRIKSNSGYCLNKPKGNPDNKCPCKEYREHMKCDCDLYVEIPDELEWGKENEKV